MPGWVRAGINPAPTLKPWTQFAKTKWTSNIERPMKKNLPISSH
jgi:hypothetical protein